ncbi:hypothetical protein [Pigmentiphaga sp.]|uniref:hypothetical protein n=1 Tax=Pigmentiphaga sp. TaxID=1977564 RepID=UPI0025E62A71|nr:hypothetical protein [Pigmentiphaga sp.]
MPMIPITPLLLDPPERRNAPPPPRRGSAVFERKLQAQEAAREAEQQRASLSQQKALARQARQMQARQFPLADREPRQPMAADRHSTGPESAVVAVADGQGCGSGGGGSAGGDQGGLSGSAEFPGEAAGGDIECDMLMDWLPERADSGIFELLLPSGDKLAVVADVGDRQVSFLLTPSSERLRAMLNKQRMELESGLTQRMNTYVRLTVL